MRRVLIFLIGALFLLEIPARGGMAPPEGLPRNVAIEVEFKEFGSEKVKVGVIGPYERRRSSEYTKQFIVVSDGLTGTIRVGEDVPHIEYYRSYLCRHGYVESYDITFKEVGTKLVVTPKIRGNNIEVTLTPQITYLSGSRRDIINVKELSTSVIVANGQSISIGGLIKDDEFKSYFFKTKEASNLDITLTPRIQ